MEVAVARVEHVADREPVALADASNRLEYVGERRARHHGVLDYQVARQPAHRAERFLATLPQPFPLLLVRRRAHGACAVSLEDALDGAGVGRDRLVHPPVELDEQHGGGVPRIAGRVDRVLHGADAGLIHHLERGGDDAARDHRRNRLSRGTDGREVRQ